MTDEPLTRDQASSILQAEQAQYWRRQGKKEAEQQMEQDIPLRKWCIEKSILAMQHTRADADDDSVSYMAKNIYDFITNKEKASDKLA